MPFGRPPGLPLPTRGRVRPTAGAAAGASAGAGSGLARCLAWQGFPRGVGRAVQEPRAAFSRSAVAGAFGMPTIAFPFKLFKRSRRSALARYKATALLACATVCVCSAVQYSRWLIDAYRNNAMRRRERIHDEIMIIRMELESRRGNVSTSGAGESGALAESGSAAALSAAALKELEIKNKEKAIDVLQAGRRSVLAARWAKDKQGTDQPRILAENATY